MTIEEINELDQNGFIQKVGPVFENSPWIAREAWPARPFESRDELLREFTTLVKKSGQRLQLALIEAHPDLAGRLAEAGELTEESSREQAAAGLDEIDRETKSSIREQNDIYREKFGFPFVICARLNNPETILSAFEERLKQNREEEIETALGEIFKIAKLRLFDLLRGH